MIQGFLIFCHVLNTIVRYELTITLLSNRYKYVDMTLNN